MKLNSEKSRKLPRSVIKYIRHQKALIRRTYSDTGEIENKLKELMSKFNG